MQIASTPICGEPAFVAQADKHTGIAAQCIAPVQYKQTEMLKTKSEVTLPAGSISQDSV